MAQGNALKVLDRPEASALGEMVNAELSNQIATAKKHPRDEAAALALLEKLATRSDAIAESCMYSLKRTDKDKKVVYITGPSVRFAELLNYCWGNMRAGARIIDEGDKTVTAQGVAYDLQRNTGLMLEVRRGITTSGGHRFGQDMINVTSNAACSIALRNVIFDAIPQVLWGDIYELVKAKAVGAAQIPEKLQNAVKFFISKGAKQEDIFAALQVSSIEDMGREHLEVFIGLRTALKEGSVDAAKIFTADAADQRARLVLNADDDPAQPMTPIDNLLNKNGGQSNDQAAAKVQAEGDGGAAPGGENAKGSRSKGKAPKPAAGSAAPASGAGGETAAAPKDDGSTTQQTAAVGYSSAAEQDGADAGDADREDADLVERVEAEVKAANPTERSQPIRAARGALERIAQTHADAAVKARADRLLNMFELDS